MQCLETLRDLLLQCLETLNEGLVAVPGDFEGLVVAVPGDFEELVAVPRDFEGLVVAVPGDFEGRRITVNGDKAAEMFCQVECLTPHTAPFTWLFIRPPWASSGACCKECVFNNITQYVKKVRCNLLVLTR